MKSRRVSQNKNPPWGGEHTPLQFGADDGCGSSPRGRGTLIHDDAVRLHNRFIPARAGNTVYRQLSVVSTTVHPRAGGEHNSLPRMVRNPHGSSPRGRGTQLQSGASFGPGRFIPARAGNTHRRRRSSIRSPVHPRAGGEHSWSNLSWLACGGSSPRGRGTLRDAGRGDADRRFIPARAGNTRRPQMRRHCPTVHPRAGGGTPPVNAETPLSVRFIPARAGNTDSYPPPAPAPPVHPRAGGEHTPPHTTATPTAGSSPRGRGTPTRHFQPPSSRRFIPARAGNTTLVGTT